MPIPEAAHARNSVTLLEMLKSAQAGFDFVMDCLAQSGRLAAGKHGNHKNGSGHGETRRYDPRGAFVFGILNELLHFFPPS